MPKLLVPWESGETATIKMARFDNPDKIVNGAGGQSLTEQTNMLGWYTAPVIVCDGTYLVTIESTAGKANYWCLVDEKHDYIPCCERSVLSSGSHYGVIVNRKIEVLKKRIIVMGQDNVVLTVKVYEADRVTARDVSTYNTFSLIVSKVGSKKHKTLSGASAGTDPEDIDYTLQREDFDAPGIWRVIPRAQKTAGSIDYYGPWEEIEVRDILAPVAT